MRRGRHRLQVSTFPFLAVLLCTMGSLILVLLMMDRKSRQAALARAQREAAQLAQAQADAARAQREQWQRQQQQARADRQQQCQQMHERLLGEAAQVQAQADQVARELALAAARLRAEQSSKEETRKQTLALRGRLAAQQQALETKRQGLAQKARAGDATAEELARMTAELMRLEETIHDLRTARERERQTYSVVPYRGSHGDARRPLYVECVPAGLIFHPEKQLVVVTALDSVKEEVRRRLARHHQQARSDRADPGPYMLLLVRPDGIRTANGLQGLLREMNVDFGYELVDADWILDFPPDDQPLTQPWMTAQAPAVPPPLPAAGPAPTGKPLTHGVRGTGGLGVPTGIGRPGVSGEAFPQSSSSAGDAMTDSGGGMPKPQPIAQGGPMAAGPLAPAPPSPAGDRPLAVGPGTALSGPVGSWGDGSGTSTLPARPGTAASSFTALAPVGGSTSPGAVRWHSLDRPISQSPAPAAMPGTGSQPLANPAVPNSPGGVRQEAVASTGMAAPGTAGSSMAASPVQMQNPAGAAAPANGQSGTPLADTRVASVPQDPPSPPSSAVAQTPPPPASGPGAPGPPTPGAGSAAAGGGDGEPGQSLGRAEARFAPQPPPLPAKGPRRAIIPRPVSLRGDRDWTLFVECSADGVIIHPTSRAFTLVELMDPSNPLLMCLQEMIARRQALVRPGDLPYRPQVRFLVRPQHMRIYHAVFPCLDALPVPKSRQNLQPEDDIAAIVYGS